MLPRLSALTLAALTEKTLQTLFAKLLRFILLCFIHWDFLTRLAATTSLCIHVIHQENGWYGFQLNVNIWNWFVLPSSTHCTVSWRAAWKTCEGGKKCSKPEISLRRARRMMECQTNQWTLTAWKGSQEKLSGNCHILRGVHVCW